ncbi:putative SAM-dependent methyltransferase [Sulfurimonas gotlandica GD1]|uniref:Putative SAM-dependent methyltransferase n=1 Tax=Sulfurimonas gotlandica (strain DSM 19862 / JCM 16533 / GD1) TaxID=929558 RepID=H1FZN4_SULGG|nr:class I SAM-dependent methyltransferase [Sulfurimonas gotlandica]EHP31041.1 putative SAM-dependent methyltransferase [Sulfurimonas gotlandica GD1]
MTISDIQKHLEENSKDLSTEFKRLFHGRGELYKGWKHLSVDSIDDILSVALYFEEENEVELIEMLKSFVASSRHKTIVLQRRYIKGSPSELIVGELADDLFVVENGMKIKLNLLSNLNSGYFPDMKNGREFVKANSKDKSVLNLFSYTCAFSVAAMLGGAYKVFNIDMSKSALSTGRTNHHLNDIDTKSVSFFSYNILKSFSSIKRKGPYDLIIIDPPTFQKGSFEATKDYRKLINKLEQIASEDCTLLACLNSPDLEAEFIKELIKELAPSFMFIKRLENVEEFQSEDEERSLKNLVFQRSKIIV